MNHNTEKCCEGARPESASQYFRRKARELRDHAHRLEKLADQTEHLRDDADQALITELQRR